jgi:hypothetical protein
VEIADSAPLTGARADLVAAHMQAFHLRVLSHNLVDERLRKRQYGLVGQAVAIPAMTLRKPSIGHLRKHVFQMTRALQERDHLLVALLGRAADSLDLLFAERIGPADRLVLTEGEHSGVFHENSVDFVSGQRPHQPLDVGRLVLLAGHVDVRRPRGQFRPIPDPAAGNLDRFTPAQLDQLRQGRQPVEYTPGIRGGQLNSAVADLQLVTIFRQAACRLLHDVYRGGR